MFFPENNLMGAAEWTGYQSSTTSSTYPGYTSFQTNTPSSYTYDTTNATMLDHHSNYHLPTVLPDIQPFCSPTDYHHSTTTCGPSPNTIISPTQGPSVCSTTYPTTAKVEVETLNTTYPSYNNWSNGYNNYQYSSCTAQPQYPTHHPAPTMVLYPQLYSTVNQNQIHLHLHGTDKIEQYLGPDNSLTISSITSGRPAIEIGIGTSDHDISILGADNSDHHHNQQHQHHQQQETHDQQQEHREDDVVGDPGSVWRPY